MSDGETVGLRFAASDGVELEGELARAPAPARAAAVLCHPHPQHGGTMRSLVVSALFATLPAAGVTTVRFNFRGVEGSRGAYSGGRGEQLDARAALDLLDDAAPPGAADVPRVLVGWSFGADVALSLADRRVAGWVGIAPPLRFGDGIGLVGADERPKLLVLAQHDELREPEGVREVAAGWRATRVEVVAGASHFFVGRTDQVCELVAAFARELAAAT